MLPATTQAWLAVSGSVAGILRVPEKPEATRLTLSKITPNSTMFPLIVLIQPGVIAENGPQVL
jgi:hypothetical protein